MKIKNSLSFNDVLIQPKYSNVKSRSTVSTSVEINTGKFKAKYSLPVIPANMSNVVGFEMVEAIYAAKGLAILHRFMPLQSQLDIFDKLFNKYGDAVLNHFGLSIGVLEHDKDAFDQMYLRGVRIVCIDIAHGDSEHCVEMCRYIKSKDPNVLLIAGNVATGSGAKRLWKAGADVVKVGIGSGRICLTRVETGAGVPQLSAIIECAEVKKKLQKKLNRSIYLISDGGITDNGSIVKALCFADMVMAGGRFAGSDETPGKVIKSNGKTYKRYDGSSTHKSNNVEGVKAMVESKGPVKNIIILMLEAVRSGCSYQGVWNLKDLKKNPRLIRITTAGIVESGHHDVIVVT